MLSEYKGPANTPDAFRHLVGARVVACFQMPNVETSQGGTLTYIVDESGHALVFLSNGAYWTEPKAKIDSIVAARRAEIERKLAELRDLPGVDLGG